MTAPVKVVAGEAVLDDELTLPAVLARYDGDATKALADAIEDIGHLRGELALASLAMSYGFSRGWRPQITRPRL